MPLARVAFCWFRVRLFSVPGCSPLTILANVLPQLSEPDCLQLVLCFHQAQGFANDFAGGVIAPGGDFLADEFLKLGVRLMLRVMAVSGWIQS